MSVLLGLDVHGIQSYLFATSKLREIIGASRIVDDFTGAEPSDQPSIVLKRMGLTPCNSGSPVGDSWYIVVRLGGGVVRLLLPNATFAQEFVGQLSVWAIEHATSLEYDAASVPFDLETGSLADAQEKLVEAIYQQRAHANRGGGFNGFPFSAPCSLTGDPAGGYTRKSNERLCDASLDKRAYQELTDRQDMWAVILEGAAILQAPHLKDKRHPFLFDTEDFGTEDSKGSYMAVLAIDLNGLGEAGRQKTGAARGALAAHAFRSFSKDVTDATRAAFRAALDAMASNDLYSYHIVEDSVRNCGRLPIRPLVFGGDDLTFVLDARLAVAFASVMMRHFESLNFKGAAGIAFVKSKSPFNRAIDLAESLVASGKIEGRDQSRIDFMLCSGEIPGSALEGRSDRERDDCTLTGAPYTLDAFAALVTDARELTCLSRSHIRGAVDHYRSGGMLAGHKALNDLRENLERGLGNDHALEPHRRAALKSLLETKFINAETGPKPRTRFLDCVDLFRFIQTSKNTSSQETR
jgi:hypothetical protein